MLKPPTLTKFQFNISFSADMVEVALDTKEIFYESCSKEVKDKWLPSYYTLTERTGYLLDTL